MMVFLLSTVFGMYITKKCFDIIQEKAKQMPPLKQIPVKPKRKLESMLHYWSKMQCKMYCDRLCIAFVVHCTQQ